MKTENILLIILISIIIIVVIMIAEKNINDKNDKNNIMGKLNNAPISSLIEGFENTEENLDEMRKYMKIHGLYPMDLSLIHIDAADDSLRVDLGGRRIIKKNR